MATNAELKAQIDLVRADIFARKRALFQAKREALKAQLDELNKRVAEVPVPAFVTQPTAFQLPASFAVSAKQAVAITATTAFSQTERSQIISMAADIISGSSGDVDEAIFRGFRQRSPAQFDIILTESGFTAARLSATEESRLVAALAGVSAISPATLSSSVPPANSSFAGLAPGTRVRLKNGDVGEISSVSPTDSNVYGFSNETRLVSQAITTGDIAENLSLASFAPSTASGFDALLAEFGYSRAKAKEILLASIFQAGAGLGDREKQFHSRAANFSEYFALEKEAV